MNGRTSATYSVVRSDLERIPVRILVVPETPGVEKEVLYDLRLGRRRLREVLRKCLLLPIIVRGHRPRKMVTHWGIRLYALTPVVPVLKLELESRSRKEKIGFSDQRQGLMANDLRFCTISKDPLCVSRWSIVPGVRYIMRSRPVNNSVLNEYGDDMMVMMMVGGRALQMCNGASSSLRLTASGQRQRRNVPLGNSRHSRQNTRHNMITGIVCKPAISRKLVTRSSGQQGKESKSGQNAQ
ncbi:hypothetical protein F5146DRAFT_998707 [Armillaria mellea]|nr:hypothetical protein F5146DRAFT_998707 [Armillaria mellea]